VFSYQTKKELKMADIKSTTLQDAFDMDDAEFDENVIIRYFDSQSDRAASEGELETAIKWAREAMWDAVMLDSVLRGAIRLRSQNGDVAFQLADPSKFPKIEIK
jgi:hypothetical protein